MQQEEIAQFLEEKFDGKSGKLEITAKEIFGIFNSLRLINKITPEEHNQHCEAALKGLKRHVMEYPNSQGYNKALRNAVSESYNKSLPKTPAMRA